jgi:hypothetical protein
LKRYIILFVWFIFLSACTSLPIGEYRPAISEKPAVSLLLFVTPPLETIGIRFLPEPFINEIQAVPAISALPSVVLIREDLTPAEENFIMPLVPPEPAVSIISPQKSVAILDAAAVPAQEPAAQENPISITHVEVDSPAPGRAPEPVPAVVPSASAEITSTVRPASPQSSTPENTNPAIRTIFADAGSTISFSFEGNSWLFTGIWPNSGGIDLVSRDITGGKTNFTFDAEEIGSFNLKFQFQDSLAGGFLEEMVQVQVVNPDHFSRTIEQAAVTEPTGEIESTPSILELVENAINMREFSSIGPFFPAYLTLLTAETGGLLIKLSDTLGAAGYPDLAVLGLKRYLDLFPGRRGNDNVFYTLGRLFELEMIRDEKQAHENYAVVVDQYPASIYFDVANSRMKYLERHFIKVR